MFIIKKFSPYSCVRKSSFFRAAKKICEILQKNGFEAYFVGGSVRDLLLNPKKCPKDIDIATNAPPENIQHLFQSSKFVGESFGVCLVQIKGFSFEVATFRIDGEYIDKRRPQSISIGNIVEDSLRRDFTINALYYNPRKKIIKDFHNGYRDLKQKLIRCVGSAKERFEEDPLRILRVFRFAAKLNFNIEKNTKHSLQELSSSIKLIAKERVLLEFHKVENYFSFIENMLCFCDIEIFFNCTSCFEKLPKSNLKKQFYGEISHDFLRFLIYLPLFYKINVTKDLFHDLKVWPLTKADNTLCHFYLQIYLLENYFEEHHLNCEESQFMLFVHLLKIKKTCPISFRAILKSALGVLKTEWGIFIVNRLLNLQINLSHEGVVDKIVHDISMNNLPVKYTQIFIDYFHFKQFLNGASVESFVLDNIEFIKKNFPIQYPNK